MKNKRNNTQKKNGRVPATDVIKYNGPINVGTTLTGIVANLRETISIISSGSGIISYIDHVDPSGSDNWSEYSTSWLEYRVLGIKYHFMPQYKVNTATTTTVIQDTPIVFCQLHSSTAPTPSSIQEAWAYSDGKKVDSLMREKSVTWRMSDTFEAEFQDTATPSTAIYSVMFQGFGASNSITYGTIFISYLVQFRGTRK
jgi:hypothetical protein